MGRSKYRAVGDYPHFVTCSMVEWMPIFVDWMVEHRPQGYWLGRLEWAKARHRTQQRYQVWQEGCHPQAIFSAEMLGQTLEYLHNNPVVRGYVDDPAHWRYSSDRNYLGEDGLIPMTTLES